MLEIQSGDSDLPSKSITMDSDFYTGYRTNILKPDELLISITIPFTEENQYFVAYKQSRRRDDDIAIVNGAFWIEFQVKTK